MLSANTEVFFELVKAGLWEKDAWLLQFGKVDYEEVMRLAEEQSVVGLITAGLEHVKDIKVPQEWLLQFIGSTLQVEQQNKDMNVFLARLIEKLRAYGIYALLVKGQGVAQCYERPLWRACGDVDLFLSDSNYENAKQILTPLASTVEEEYVREKHLGMTIDNRVVELHGRLYCGLSSQIERELDNVLHNTFYDGAVRSWDNNGVQVFLLKVENDAFYVFTHILQHFYKEGVGLRQICDWCRLLWTYREKLDLKLLETRISMAGLMNEWRAFGAFTVKYLGLPIEVMPLYNENDNQNENIKRKAERIKDFILMSGNFGQKRDMSYYSKYPYLIRKCCSMCMRVRDLYNHAKIFPLDSLRFFPRIMFNGVRSAVRGEG